LLKIENVHVDNIVRAVYAARNAKNSWSRSDSLSLPDNTLGPNDLQLAKTLANAGSDHGKFLRMINVTCDITAPMYWIAEHDTYKVGTVRNSCSFMHKGVSKPFELADFTIEHNADEEKALANIVEILNCWRNKYLETKDFEYFRMIRQTLPQGYNIRYTWQANYAVLKNIYHARKDHRLSEWNEFCAWIKTLPYAKELIIGE